MNINISARCVSNVLSSAYRHVMDASWIQNLAVLADYDLNVAAPVRLPVFIQQCKSHWNRLRKRLTRPVGEPQVDQSAIAPRWRPGIVDIRLQDCTRKLIIIPRRRG